MNHYSEIRLNEDIAGKFEKAMMTNSAVWPEKVMSLSTVFENGIEMDIKLCAANYGKFWTEAVLFEDGCEIACSEPRRTFFGEWKVKKANDMYIARVKKVYTEKISISTEEAQIIRGYLDGTEFLHENNSVSHEAVFDNGYTMIVKCCGASRGNEVHPAWAEAVLYDHEGREVGLADAENDFFGTWEMEDKDIVYVTTVSEEPTKQEAEWNIVSATGMRKHFEMEDTRHECFV